MNENTKMGDHSILWGYAIDVWDTWGYRLMIAGAAFGAVALVVSLISSIILYKVAAVSQIELQEKTGQLEVTLKTQERLTAEARTEANKSAVELEKIKRQVAPRILSEDQQEQLYKSLLPFGRLAMAQGRPKVVLISYGMDTEGAVLGSQLLTILERAGLEAVNMLASEVPMGSFAVGVHIAGANVRFV